MTPVMCSVITEYKVGYEQSTQDAIDVLEMAGGCVIKHQMLVVLPCFCKEHTLPAASCREPHL